MSKKLIISWIVYFAFLLFTALNYIVFKLLNLEPRTWITVIMWILIVLPPFILFFFMIKGLHRFCKNGFAKGFLIFVLTVYVIVSLCVLFFLSLMSLFSMDDEKILEDGSIQVITAGFPDPGPSYRCMPVLFFARKPIPGTWKDSRDTSGTSTEAYYAQNNQDTTSDSSAADARAPEKAARLIYDRIFAVQDKKYSVQYNAKGNLYIVLDKGTRELDGTTVTTRETLTYDRISQNGKCHLFVYYEEHYDSTGNQLDNTSILNFYAANLETGEVTAADKTSWADSACEAYHEATGEY